MITRSRRIIAAHEAGHVIVTHHYGGASSVFIDDPGMTPADCDATTVSYGFRSERARRAIWMAGLQSEFLMGVPREDRLESSGKDLEYMIAADVTMEQFATAKRDATRILLRRRAACERVTLALMTEDELNEERILQLCMNRKKVYE